MIPESHIMTVKMSELINPRKEGPLLVHRDCWWLIDNEGNALYYVGAAKQFNSPQCSGSKVLIERMSKQHEVSCSVVFVPWAFEKFNISDYA